MAADPLVRAMREAERYIRQHADGALVLTLDQQRAPEWLAIRDRLDAARTARWAPPGSPPPPGQQMELFPTAGGAR